jgi:hypothetical protein
MQTRRLSALAARRGRDRVGYRCAFAIGGLLLMNFLSAIGLKPNAVVIDNPAQAASRRLVQKLEQGAHQEAEQILANATDENRERLIYGFASSERAVPVAARWATACSNSSLAHTVMGASLIVSGWKRRGDSYADDVDPAAWKPFLERLKSAEDPLHVAARLDQKSADPYAWLIHAELGGEGSRERLSGFFSEAVARVPLHWPAHYKYFNATTAKWGGSHREMFKFAESASARAPRGSILHCLTAAAFNDHALAFGRRGAKRMRTPENAAKVSAALCAWLDASPDALEPKLARVGGGFSGYSLNQFAVACYLCGADREAKEVIAALNAEIEFTPWSWVAKGILERLNPGFVHDRMKRDLASAR